MLGRRLRNVCLQGDNNVQEAQEYGLSEKQDETAYKFNLFRATHVAPFTLGILGQKRLDICSCCPFSSLLNSKDFFFEVNVHSRCSKFRRSVCRERIHGYACLRARPWALMSRTSSGRRDVFRLGTLDSLQRTFDYRKLLCSGDASL